MFQLGLFSHCWLTYWAHFIGPIDPFPILSYNIGQQCFGQSYPLMTKQKNKCILLHKLSIFSYMKCYKYKNNSYRLTSFKVSPHPCRNKDPYTCIPNF